MRSKNPPAFPFYADPEAEHANREYCGMSLRDYFAAAALQGWYASLGENSFPSESNQITIAAKCYHQADEMLAERAKEQKP